MLANAETLVGDWYTRLLSRASCFVPRLGPFEWQSALKCKRVCATQFYTEVMDSVQTLDTGRRSAYDPDELDEEQREREQRNKARSRTRLPHWAHSDRGLDLHAPVRCASEHVPLPRRSTRCTSPLSSE